MGLDDLTANHFSARVPDASNRFLIKPTALLVSEVTASNLCCYNQKREFLYETAHASNPAGPRIHGSILQARMDVMATIYLHTTAGAAVSAMDLWLEIYFLGFNALRWSGCISSLRRFGPQS
ncbi:MAG: class II aldolase/adducin family protein [Pseudomonadota bacterium]|nr:class II aldolase/adducin family protein [Pseudomonadota bacterium]